MKPTLLLPTYFKFIGIALAIPGFILGCLFSFGNYVIPFFTYGLGTPKNSIIAWNGMNNYTDELAITFLVTGLIFIGFSRLNNENEQTHKLRLSALYWAVFVNLSLVAFVLSSQYIVFAIKAPVVINNYNSIFYAVVDYNLFFMLMLFIARFNYQLVKQQKDAPLPYFPYKPFKMAGKITTFFFVLLGIAFLVQVPGFDIPGNIFVVALPCILLLMGAKVKGEDNNTKSRLKAMQMAVYINYGLLIIATWGVYSIEYLAVLSMGLISIQFIFLAVFSYSRFRLSKATTHNSSGFEPGIV